MTAGRVSNGDHSVEVEVFVDLGEMVDSRGNILERCRPAAAAAYSVVFQVPAGPASAGEVESEAVKRGIAYLMAAPREGLRWKEEWYTAVGFPRVFYLRYHGYAAFFPLWALARYRNLKQGNDRTTAYGM